MILRIIIGLGIGFLGYVIGRIGHVLGGSLPAPHHWIYGLLLVILGAVLLFVFKKFYGYYILMFGLGLFISDLYDFLNLRFYGVDIVEEYKFWGFD